MDHALTAPPTDALLDALLVWFATIDEQLAHMQAYAVVTSPPASSRTRPRAG